MHQRPDFCRYAWYKLYNLAKSYNKNLAASDVQMLAGNVLLSALAISPYSAADSARSEADAEQEKERSARMANLLGFTVVRARPPTCLGPCSQVEACIRVHASAPLPHSTHGACLPSCQLSSTEMESSTSNEALLAAAPHLHLWRLHCW